MAATVGLEHGTDAPALRRRPAVVLTAVAVCMVVPVAADRAGAALGIPGRVFRPAVVVPLELLVVIAAARWVLEPAWNVRRSIGRPRALREVGGLAVAVPMAVIGYGVGMILAELVSAVLSLGWLPSLTTTTSYFGGDRPWVLGVVAILYSYLGAPLIEEVLFRLLALRALLAVGLSAGTAVLASSALFAVWHLPLGGASDPLAVAGLFGLGVVLGALAWWTGRLALVLTAHIGFNVAATISASL